VCPLGGNLEDARHHRLDVAVAVIAECFDDALARNDADQLGSAHNWKVILQGVDATGKRVSKCVRGREGGEVREHDLAHVNGIDNGLEEDALILNLRADHDEEASNDEPRALQQHSANHGGEREQLANAAGGAARRREAMGSREVTAQQAAASSG